MACYGHGKRIHGVVKRHMTVENCQFKGYLPTFNGDVSVQTPSLIPGGHLELENWKRVGRSLGLLHLDAPGRVVYTQEAFLDPPSTLDNMKKWWLAAPESYIVLLHHF